MLNRIYTLSRYLMVLGIVAATYCIALMLWVTLPWSGILAAVLFIAAIKNQKKPRLTTLGSACWADEVDLRRAGMIGADAGLILGRIHSNQGGDLAGAIGKLFSWRLSGSDAYREFWRTYRGKSTSLVRLPQAVHTAAFSPTGGGKNVSCIVPFLANCEESCVIVDFKGENARLTAEYRRVKLGHQIVLLDPYQIVVPNPATYNPLDFIEKNSPCAIDDCNDLANALVVRSGNENEPHWNDSAEFFISAIITTVVAFGERDKGTRSLGTVREILSHPAKLDMAIKLMTESDNWNGLLAQMGGQLMHFIDREKSSVISSALRHLRFLGTPAVAENTRVSTFDPAALRKGRMTVYLILPPDRAHAQSGLLRCWTGSLLKACVRGGLQ